jgi:hypothetical protein
MRHRRISILVLLAWVAAFCLCLPAAADAQGPGALLDDPPVLAYYYIRYRPESWGGTKVDYPLLGRYSSDDIEVMRRHAEWAKAAGIDGFIVSWKSTDTLNFRLEQLMQASHEAGLKLTIIYQGLDYERNPRTVGRVADDLANFAGKYGQHPVFDLFERPVILWNGSWEYSRRDVTTVMQQVGTRLLILATEKSAQDYSRLADLVDGNAYYWSSANPDTYPGYEGKLISMGQAVHEHGGLWIAPAAPGYDGTAIGGVQVVPRANGQTLRRQMAAARNSSPDAIGLISWNEFSENTFVEPSEGHGTRYLGIVAEIMGVTTPAGAATAFAVEPFEVQIHTVPALAGAPFQLGECAGVADQQGVARIEVSQTGTYTLVAPPADVAYEGCRAEFERWGNGVIAPQVPLIVPAEGPIQSGFGLHCPVDLTFVDPKGRAVDAERVESVTLLSSEGSRHTLSAFESVWLPAAAVVERVRGLDPVELGYTVESVILDGSNVVNRAQQRVRPRQGRQQRLELLVYSARFKARDALFGFPIGERLLLESPHGDTSQLPLGNNGEAVVDSLARGVYRIRVDGAPGIPLWVPMALSRDQTVSLLVVSYLDIAALSLGLLAFALLPLLLGRPGLRSAMRARVASLMRSQG